MPIYPTKETRALKFKGSPLFPSAQAGISDAQTTRFVAEPPKQERGLKFTNRASSNLEGARQIQNEPGYVMTGKEKRAMKKPAPASDDIKIDDPYSFDPYQWTSDSVKNDLGEIFVNTFGEDAEMESLTPEQRIGLQQNIEHVRQKRLKRALDARNVALKKVEAEAKKAAADAKKKAPGALTANEMHSRAHAFASKRAMTQSADAYGQQKLDPALYESEYKRFMEENGAKAGGRAAGATPAEPDSKAGEGKKIKILKVAKNAKGQKLGLTEEGKWVPLQ